MKGLKEKIISLIFFGSILVFIGLILSISHSLLSLPIFKIISIPIIGVDISPVILLGFLLCFFGKLRKAFEIQVNSSDEKCNYLDITKINPHEFNGFKLQDVSIRVNLVSKIYKLRNFGFSVDKFLFFLIIDFENDFFDLTYKSPIDAKLKEKISESPHEIDMSVYFKKPRKKCWVDLTFGNIREMNKDDSPITINLQIKSERGNKFCEWIGNKLFFCAQKEVRILTK